MSYSSEHTVKRGKWTVTVTRPSADSTPEGTDALVKAIRDAARGSTQGDVIQELAKLPGLTSIAVATKKLPTVIWTNP